MIIMTTQYDSLWQYILKELNKSYSDVIYQEVFEPITNVHKFHNGLLFMVVPSLHIKNRINRFYINKINELAENISDQKLRFKFITKEELDKEEKENEKLIQNVYRAGNLNSVYTFENLVIGKSNNF